MKLSNMDDSFLNNVHLSLYWLWVFLDCGSRSDVTFARIGCDFGDAQSSLIGCWGQLWAATNQVQHGGLRGWVVFGIKQ